MANLSAERGASFHRYPRASEISRLVKAARANGVAVQSLWVGPDGRIGVHEENNSSSDQDEFTRWDMAGLL